jgi:hypothetical protein
MCSVHALVPYVYNAQNVLKEPFRVWKFYAYAEHKHKELLQMLSNHLSSLCICSVHS